VIGSKSLVNVPDFSFGASTGGMVVVGGNVFQTAPAGTELGGLVAIGANIAGGATITGNPDMIRNTLVGNGIWANIGAVSGLPNYDNVIIGYQAATGDGSFASAIGNVIIGNSAAPNRAAGGGGLNSCVVIGHKAFESASGSTTSSVLIGTQVAGGATSLASCTYVGAAITSGNFAHSVAIGSNVAAGGSYNTFVGEAINSVNANFCIIIGRGADAGTGSTDGQFVLGVLDAGAGQHTMLYGDMFNGNLIVGNSTQGVNRDFRGTSKPTNALKLLNQTGIGPGAGASPIGGGFFYVNSGALHWFGSSGTDTLLAPA